MTKLLHRLSGRRHIWLALVCMTLVIGLSSCLYIRGGHKDVWPDTAAKPVPGNGYTIYAAGDVANCKNKEPDESGAAKTAALIGPELDKDSEAAVLVLGDATYPVGRIEEFTNCYDPTWGRFKERTYPAPGNHEYYTPGAIGYFAYFGIAARRDNRSYYSVNLGKWHVISLNSNLLAGEQKQQMAWLKADLAANKSVCTLAYWHHPVFSSGGHGNNEMMKEAWQLLDAANADVVLSSHDHDYERFAPQNAEGRRDDARGIREFIVGTGGAKLTSFGLRKTNSAVSSNIAHGVLKMVLKDSGYEWEFLPVAGGSFSDKGTGLCH